MEHSDQAINYLWDNEKFLNTNQALINMINKVQTFQECSSRIGQVFNKRTNWAEWASYLMIMPRMDKKIIPNKGCLREVKDRCIPKF